MACPTTGAMVMSLVLSPSARAAEMQKDRASHVLAGCWPISLLPVSSPASDVTPFETVLVAE